MSFRIKRSSIFVPEQKSGTEPLQNVVTVQTVRDEEGGQEQMNVTINAQTPHIDDRTNTNQGSYMRITSSTEDHH